MSRKIVITGSLCSRKTTLINALQEHGYYTLSESALAVIKQENSKDFGVLPWTDIVGFQRKVIRRQLKLEDSIPEKM